MKKKEKIYVSRFVPYSVRIKRQRLSLLKAVAFAAASACVALALGTIFAAKFLPEDLYVGAVKGASESKAESAQTELENETETGFIYPQPDEQTRAKANRLRELNNEEFNLHNYIPADGEMDNVYVYDSKKMCYLTFDDGPSAVTPQILEILKSYNIKATFFVTGVSVSAHPDMLAAIYNDGHSVGNHSYSHVYDSVYSSADGFKNELLSCKNAVNEALGFEYENLIFRFPGGYTSLTDPNTKAAYTAVLKEQGYKFIDWSCLTGDSNVTDPTPDYLINTLKYGIGNTKTGDIVVLMHDSSTKQATADALSSVIDYLKSCGYQFAALKNE